MASQPPADPQPPAAPRNEPPRSADRTPHALTFTSYPKLIFIWPMLLFGFIAWPFAGPEAVRGNAPAPVVAPAATTVPATPATAPAVGPVHSARLELLGWLHIALVILVILTLGVDVNRNFAIFLLVLFALVYLGGMYLRDVQHFTLLGDIYSWFASLNVQYNRALGLVLSILLLIPYVLMLGRARLDSRWRITHNEFEHTSFGRADDSLGRGAKTIRTEYPDVLELLLGLAGTLIVFNASGTRELRRIPHVLLLPLLRRRLDLILERTAVISGQYEEEEEDQLG